MRPMYIYTRIYIRFGSKDTFRRRKKNNNNNNIRFSFFITGIKFFRPYARFVEYSYKNILYIVLHKDEKNGSSIYNNIFRTRTAIIIIMFSINRRNATLIYYV